MKNTLLVLLAISVSPALFAQKDSGTDLPVKETAGIQKKFTCDSIAVDFETGLLNGKLNASSPVDSIKKYLPCVTSEIAVGSEDRVCGGGALLEKQGIYFNREHGFIEFSSSTSVHFTVQVYGVAEDDLPAVIGDPAQITDLQPYTDRPMQSVYLFPKSYGCLAVWVDQKDKKVFKVQLHSLPPDKAFLCVE